MPQVLKFTTTNKRKWVTTSKPPVLGYRGPGEQQVF